jgi:sporulation protein YlmC with PRC-barrel domain
MQRMKAPAAFALALFCLQAPSVHAQSANASTPAAPERQASASATGEPDIGVIELDVITPGWSAKRDILGKPVYNEQKQRIGKITDIIITPDNAVSFAIIGAGGFLGVGRHDVVIPVDQMRSIDDHYVLPGATKAALKALPAFHYRRAKQ